MYWQNGYVYTYEFLFYSVQVHVIYQEQRQICRYMYLDKNIKIAEYTTYGRWKWIAWNINSCEQ